MTKSAPSIVFFGTPHLAVWVLEELEAEGIIPSLIVTAPDRPAGRKLVLTPPAVKLWADEHDIPVLQVESLKDRSAVPELVNSEWDLFVVAAYNIILPEWILTLPHKGVLNVHPSLLPRLRGSSPIRSAILRDERDAVGVSIMLLDEQVDHGPLLAQARVELPEWPVHGSVLDELLFREGGRLLVEVLPLWLQGTLTPEAQDHTQATYTKKFIKTDGEIDLAGDAYQNYLKYCAMDGWPGVYMFTDTSKKVRLKVTDAVYENGTFRVLRVIPEGKREIDYADFLAH
ncbi:MAG: methionyl-tRNA formyltransferase [Candidatus Pacebacteria bacterium]|nr:methionyl-tRNA formyltransferase [Candidatus Paceibacterota bacterium]